MTRVLKIAGTSVIACMLVAPMVLAVTDGPEPTPRVAALVSASKEKNRVESSPLFHDGKGNLLNPLTNSDLPEAVTYVKEHRDYSSFFLLFAIRRHHTDAYKSIPNKDKAAIFCSVLKNARCFNDWGHPRRSFDGDSAKALVEIGKDALEYLAPLLDDDSRAVHVGSKESTESYGAQYRRKDFAYRYVCLILNRPAEFRQTHVERDKDIEALKRELKKRPQ